MALNFNITLPLDICRAIYDGNHLPDQLYREVIEAIAAGLQRVPLDVFRKGNIELPVGFNLFHYEEIFGSNHPTEDPAIDQKALVLRSGTPSSPALTIKLSDDCIAGAVKPVRSAAPLPSPTSFRPATPLPSPSSSSTPRLPPTIRAVVKEEFQGLSHSQEQSLRRLLEKAAINHERNRVKRYGFAPSINASDVPSDREDRPSQSRIPLHSRHQEPKSPNL